MSLFHICLVLQTASVWFVQESQQQKELVEQRYIKYKEIVQNLQHQLDESKHRMQEYRVRHTNTLTGKHHISSQQQHTSVLLYL